MESSASILNYSHLLLSSLGLDVIQNGDVISLSNGLNVAEDYECNAYVWNSLQTWNGAWIRVLSCAEAEKLILEVYGNAS